MSNVKKKPKANSRAILGGGLVAALVGIFLLLKSCAPGFLGFGTGDGDGESTDPAVAEEIKKDLSVDRSVSVTITGEKCFFQKNEQDCTALCNDIRKYGDKNTTVVLDSANTSHAFAETFRECLRKDDKIKNFVQPE